METFCITGCKEAETMMKQRPRGERSHDTEGTEAGGQSRKQINRSPAAETSLSPWGPTVCLVESGFGKTSKKIQSKYLGRCSPHDPCRNSSALPL